MKRAILIIYLLTLALMFVSCIEQSKTKINIDAFSIDSSILTVSNPQVGSGATVTITLFLKTASGKAFSESKHDIVFSLTSGTSLGSLGTISNNQDGSFSATYSGISPGTPKTIAATVNGKPVLTTKPTIEVVVGNFSPAHSTLQASGSSVDSGDDITITLTARDISGAQLVNGGLNVLFSHTGGTSTGTWSAVTDNLDGTYTANFTGVVSGTATDITATINGQAVTTTSPSVAVNIGDPDAIAISSGDSQSGTAGLSLASPLTVAVTDAGNNAVPGVVINWVATAGDGSLSSASSTTNGSGLASSNLTLGAVAGNNTVSATVDGSVLNVSFSATGAWDTDASSYFARVTTANSGVDSMLSSEKANINSFINGLKTLGYFDDVVACWSFRSGQNTGAGNTVVEILGNHNGTLVNSPTWGVDGIAFSATNQSITYANNFSLDFTGNGSLSFLGVYSGMGTAVTNYPTYDNFSLLSSPGGQLVFHVSNGVGGGTTFMEQALSLDGKRHYSWPTSVSSSGNHSFGWNASNGAILRNGSALSVGTVATSVQTNGNYTLGTYARNQGNSRISFILLLDKTLSLTNTEMAAINTLYKTTLGQGLALP
jgi:hypothetical protein